MAGLLVTSGSSGCFVLGTLPRKNESTKSPMIARINVYLRSSH